jgi:hypothetical protein
LDFTCWDFTGRSEGCALFLFGTAWTACVAAFQPGYGFQILNVRDSIGIPQTRLFLSPLQLSSFWRQLQTIRTILGGFPE